ncbi:MAG: aspartate-semialdehyde dehydrogenase [Myxococcales bacterium]
MSKSFHVAVLGATGAVGREFVNCLEERGFPVDKLTLLASPRSEGEKLEFKGEELTVRAVKPEHFQGVDLAFFSPGATVSNEWAPIATKAGALVIDDSTAFRMDADVPLVVPEVNPDAILGARPRGIVANPNCATIQMVLALKPIHDAANLLRVVVSTYQAVSGRGQKGIQELEKQTGDLMNGRETETSAFPHRVAFNVVPQIDDFDDNGYTKEELRIVHETRKILGIKDLRVSATAVRVPVFFGHSEAVNVTTEKKLTAAQARELLKAAPGLKVIDDPKAGIYPMPMLAAGDDCAHVGRIREDISQMNGLDFFVVADNIRKGAGLNAVQIAELLVQRGVLV